MEDYQKRIVEEKTALDIKIDKLDYFLKNNAVPEAEAKRMYSQLGHMCRYSEVLTDRIDNFI
jgi:hypothetical protein